MYYYLSFLRPPPKTASPAEPITITPQIANDLRTELKEDTPTDIYYTWQRIPVVSPQHTTQTVKLTTYNPPVNTYKPLSIPLPAAAKQGETWRLGLFAPPAREVQGSLDALERHVCGVWSEGISVTAPRRRSFADNAAAGKQTRVFREWRVPRVNGGGASPEPTRVLKIVEQTSFDLDKKIWDSGLALSAWLHVHLAHPTSHPLTRRYMDRLTAQRRTRILELGAGTGLVSFALAAALRALGRTAQTGEAYDIYATDLGSAIPLIDENTAINSHLWDVPTVEAPAEEAEEEVVEPVRVSVHSEVLDWDEPLPSWVHPGESSGIDLIIAADVTYNTASFPALISTLRALLHPASSASTPPLLLLAYKQRDPSERELWRLAREQGIELHLVDVIRGHEAVGAEGATEIWIGGVGLRSDL